MVTVLFVWLYVHTALVLAGLLMLTYVEIRSDSKTDAIELAKAAVFIVALPALFWFLYVLLRFNRGGLGGWI
ncbi:hypothetical protein AM598_06650 [Paenibacillus polymyxa]|nr:hypothetical protein AM598_06650 [Paenibacillus polymyxa]